MVKTERSVIMSQFFQAVFLGLVQGLTEFLPVSSSGHLVLFQSLFGLTEGNQTFNVLRHMATLVAVFAVFFDDILKLIKHPFSKLTALLITGTIPTVIIALLFGDTIDKVFGSGRFIGINFIITGLVLLYADSRAPGRKSVEKMTGLDAAIVGTLQGIALCPAISRSGMTIAGSLGRKLDRESAARFSFLLSIPAILGAMVLTLKDIIKGDTAIGQTFGVVPTIFACIVAAVSGYFAIRFMISIIKKGKLRYFSYYVFVLGAFICADQFFLHMFFKA